MSRQLAAIEAGVDPTLVGERVRRLKSELQDTEAAQSELERSERTQGIVDTAQACELLEALPNLSDALTNAAPEQRREVYNAFRLRVEIDRNTNKLRLKALVSSAFTDAKNLDDVVSRPSGHSGGPIRSLGRPFAVPIEWSAKVAPQAGKRRRA